MTDSELEADEALADAQDAAPPAESDGLDGDIEAADEGEGQADEGVFEDIEHEGRTYQVPRALKSAFLMQADYTRKTQELAEQRRELEAERADQSESAEARVRLAAVEQRLSALGTLDWDALHAEDPQSAEQLLAHVHELAQARDQLAGELARWGHRRALAEQHERATKVHEGQAVLERDLAGWSPQMARQLASFAIEAFGVTPEELAEVHDPRLVKLLHAAYVGANAGGTNRQARRHAEAQASRPAATVGGRAAAGKDPNRMTTDEWMRHRNSQLRRAR